MSLYYALKALDVSTVHYSRHFNATTGRESTSYSQGGGPVPLLKPLFQDSHPAPPVDLAAVRKLDLRFLGEHTDALLDTPAQVCSRGLLVGLQPYVCEAATHPRRLQPMHAGCNPMHRGCNPLCPGLFFLTNTDGSARRCGPGDTVVLPKGWSGHWDIIEAVKKVWVVLSD